MLHMLSRSPYADATLLRRIETTLAADDALVLIEDGVLGAIGEMAERLGQYTCKVYVLDEDLAIRGLKDQVGDDINVMTMAGFVDLSVSHSRSLSWY